MNFHQLRFILLFSALTLPTQVLAERDDLGMPCEMYIGVYRSIEIGHPITYAIELLEKNNFRCKEFKGMAKEIVTCDLKLDIDFQSEISLIVENGKVADFETRNGGLGCQWNEQE